MSVNTKDVDKALETKQRVDAIQSEQHDIAAAEQLGIDQNEDSRPPKRVVEDGEVDVTDHKPTRVDPRTEYANELLKSQRERRDQEINEAQDNNGYRREDEDDDEDFDDDVYGERDEDLDNDLDNEEHEFAQQSNDDVDLDKPGFYGDTVVLKINGQNVRMDAQKALSILQKDQSADQKLEQASLKERQLQQREHALQLQQTQPPYQGVARANSAEVQQEVKAAFEFLEEGETGKAVEHLTRVLSHQQPTATADQVANQVRQQLKVEQATNAESRLKNSGKYDDVFNDPTAFNLAVQNVKHLNSQGYSASVEDVMVEAIEMVRDFRSGVPRKERLARSQDDKPNSNRRQQKRKAPKSVSSSTSSPRKAVVKKNEPTATQKRQSIFEQQKTARNQ